jgi:hypothetical protein
MYRGFQIVQLAPWGHAECLEYKLYLEWEICRNNVNWKGRPLIEAGKLKSSLEERLYYKLIIFCRVCKNILMVLCRNKGDAKNRQVKV